MIIEFSKELEKQDFYANGKELASIMGLDKDEAGKRVYEYPDDKRVHVATLEKPVLVTDIYRITQLEPTQRDTVFKLFESSVRHTIYDGVSIDFEQEKYPGVWGPSIDTVAFCLGLSRLDLSKIKNAIEIGAGSGFISKYLLEKLPNLKSMDLVDLNQRAEECWKDNINDPRAHFYIEDGALYMESRKTDLLICNPPYIPRPRSIDDNAYEGIGLMRFLISGAKKTLSDSGILVINYSSLSEKEAMEAISESGMTMETLVKMEVPLKVCNVLNNSEWVNYLLQRGMQSKNQNGYQYWHNIFIVALRRT
ncbi:MAG: methyltransferase [Candidatus Colwellbacteria bacterium]|nr:methyltransferase [Candidatus Colwellbacteria bacterium]